jgi:hypothetical protein
MRYAVIVLLLVVVIVMLLGVVITYVRREIARNKRHVERITEDLPVWGSPPDVKY